MGDLNNPAVPNPTDRETVLAQGRPWQPWPEKEVSRYREQFPHAGPLQVSANSDGFNLVEKGVGGRFDPYVSLQIALLRRYISRSGLQRPPGYGLLWFADFFYSRKSVDECLRPTIQDLQDEYVEALAAKRPQKARWVRIRGTWSFLCAAGLLTMVGIGKQVVKIWKAVG
jgi:hypothetical protein